LRHSQNYQSFIAVAYKIPVMVVTEIDPNHAASCNLRTGRFKPDPTVRAGIQASAADYKASGMDKGHMATAEDNLFDAGYEADTFLYTNAIPQYPDFNRGTWKLLETWARDQATTRGHVLAVYSGVAKFGSVSIGDGVNIPAEFFKVVVDLQTKEAVAFKLKSDESGHDLGAFVVQNNQGVPLPFNNWKMSPVIWAKPTHKDKDC
jgi:DNA/RNA endonuclease G (NUC1)